MANTMIAQNPASATLFDRLRVVPGMKQLLLLLGLAAAIAGGLSLFTWASKPAAQPVFSGLPESENAAIADALTAEGIAHQIDSASGAVMVSAEQLRQARMALAGRGLPNSAASGFEMIAGEQGFGVSQSIESARMQHALETELVRTISSLQAVRSARVHLAIPKPSAFTRAGGGGSSASVLVELHPGRSLNSQQVQSIVHMVASSVPDMQAGSVTVIDQAGHLLTEDATGGTVGMSNSQFEQIKRVEDATRHRVEDILAPLMGAARVRTQVVADLDFTAEEVTQEQYQPDPTAIRSEQTSEDISRDGSTNKAMGVPGATSNKPPEPGASAATAPAAATPTATPAASAPAAAAADMPSAQTRNTTRNYELNKTVSYRKPAAGRIRRLNVAVLVDYLPKADAKGAMIATALTAAELGRIESLVKEAVGFDTARGDRVTVQNAPFVVEAIAAIPPVPMIERPELQSLARQGGGVLVLLVLLLGVVRPLLKNLFSTPLHAPALMHSGLAALAAPQSGDDEMPQAPGKRRPAAIPQAHEGPSAYEQKITIARETVKADPKKVAQVMKTWIAQEN